MTIYNKFKKLDIDFSQLGLEQGDNSPYFCTPKGAKIIGWAGIDGIHCCFVKGFDEMVFAVNPSNLPGDYVHPLARNFSDFIRIILACGLDAAEQAWMWNRGEFDAFTETYPPDSNQQAALDGLRNGLGLEPMEDPYGYIKNLQASFDYAQIPYTKAYHALVADSGEEKAAEPYVWRVYYGGFFGSHHSGHDKPGEEVHVGKSFNWCGRVWHIPSVYICGKGLVMDMCIEADVSELLRFSKKWRARSEENRELTQEEWDQKTQENPLNIDFAVGLTLNGKALHCSGGSALYWTPSSCQSQEGELVCRDSESLHVIEHYGLDEQKGWTFWREYFPWVTKTKPTIKSLSVSLKQHPSFVNGGRFTASGIGDSVPLVNPLTGDVHTLHVIDYNDCEADVSRFKDKDIMEYPTHYIAMSYTVQPECDFSVNDCGQGDAPRMKSDKEREALMAIGGADGSMTVCSVGIIGGADGPSVIVSSGGKSVQKRMACSALYFEAPGKIEWRTLFRKKPAAGIDVSLIVGQ